MKSLWKNLPFFGYVDRWVSVGTWTQPDPCAPSDGDWNNYGVTYGPDGSGDCLKDTNPNDGVGRFPQKHGENKDQGNRDSKFARAMWNAYRYFSIQKVQNLRISGEKL